MVLLGLVPLNPFFDFLQLGLPGLLTLDWGLLRRLSRGSLNPLGSSVGWRKLDGWLLREDVASVEVDHFAVVVGHWAPAVPGELLPRYLLFKATSHWLGAGRGLVGLPGELVLLEFVGWVPVELLLGLLLDIPIHSQKVDCHFGSFVLHEFDCVDPLVEPE